LVVEEPELIHDLAPRSRSPRGYPIGYLMVTRFWLGFGPVGVWNRRKVRTRCLPAERSLKFESRDTHLSTILTRTAAVMGSCALILYGSPRRGRLDHAYRRLS